MRYENFYRNPHLPFAELRYSRSSTAAFKPHVHRALSIGAVEQGEVLYNVAGREAVLAPGSLVIINPETLHACNPATEAGRSYYMLHLDIDWCQQVQESLWAVDRFVKASEIRIDHGPLYEQYCDTMAHLMVAHNFLQEKEQRLFDLAAGIFTKACSPQAAGPEPRENIETLKRLLSSDLHRDYPLNSLAAEMGINPYTLIRRFKALTGLTPHAYRMNCRIERARSLLRQGRSIADTALACGFFDQSHFHRHFKSMTTVTPQEYQVNFVQ